MTASPSRKKLEELLSNAKVENPKEGITECTRCCTCCAKGGPALHIEDKELIDSGKLHGKFLFTIRDGEPAEDNVKGGLMFTEGDIIKIKSKEGSDACLYLDIHQSSCAIYNDRPLECRVLRCWDTQEIEEVYEKNRLSRKDLLGHIGGLWDTIEEHQEKCSFKKVKQILDENPKEISGDALKALLEMIQFDISIRELIVEKTNTDANLLPFLFGKPLQEILRKFGIELKRKEDT